MIVKYTAIIISLCLVLLANQHDKALQFYKNKEYTKAFEIFLQEAKDGHKASQYRIADMYDKGLGIAQDPKEATYWYKQSAEKYSNTLEPQDDGEASWWNDVKHQFTNENFQSANEFMAHKLDTYTPESKQAVHSITDSDFFGLQAYQTNFFLPISAGLEKPPYIFTAFHPNQLVSLGIPLDEQVYEKKVEAEFQVSFKKLLSYNLFGWNEFIYGTYTQKVWWQVYAETAPFRDTNYLPELFMSVPTSLAVDEASGLKMVKFGFLHESNGQDGYKSRSWNRLYLSGQWQWGNLFLNTRAWYRLPEEDKSDEYYAGTSTNPNEAGDDNPDILDYMGYGDIKFDYLYGQSQFGLLLRNNLKLNNENKGAVELNWSYALFHSDSMFLYTKLFHGYGENLITYDRKVSKAAFGFAMTRSLFQ